LAYQSRFVEKDFWVVELLRSVSDTSLEPFGRAVQRSSSSKAARLSKAYR